MPHPPPRGSVPAGSAPSPAWRRGGIAIVVAGLAATAGCRPSISIPTGMVVGGASLGYLGHELADDDPRLGLMVGVMSGLLLGTGIGLIVGITHELREAYDEED